MTHATLYDTRLAPTATVGNWLTRVRQALADRVLYTRTRDELNALTDRDLRDLGLYRHDIDRIARDAVYGA